MPRMRSMRLPTKPSQTPTSTGILPIFWRRHDGGDHVLAGRLAAHVLQSFITLAGEKKCMPITSPGRLVYWAI